MDASILIPAMVLGLGSLLALAVAGRREPRPFDRVLVSLAWGPGLAAGIESHTTKASAAPLTAPAGCPSAAGGLGGRQEWG